MLKARRKSVTGSAARTGARVLLEFLLAFGYGIGRAYWGQGLIPEAAQALIAHGREDLTLTRIWCGWFDGNEKSRRVQEKLGFRYDRTEPDVPCAIPGVLHTVHVSRLDLQP